VLEVTVADGVVDANDGAVFRTPTSTFVLLGGPHQYGHPSAWVRAAVEASPTGQFAAPPKITVKSEAVVTGWGDGTAVGAVADLVRERGPAPWHPAAVDRLVDATGMTRAEATLLLAGAPGMGTWESNFLDVQQRKLLGLKVTEARSARDSLKGMSHELRSSLLAAAMPADPEDLWRHGPDVDAVAATWRRHFGQSLGVPADLAAEGGRVIGHQDAVEIIRTIAAPRVGGWLHTDGVSAQDGWHTRTRSSHGEPFDDDCLTAVGVALPWLAYRLPTGHPIRSALPAAHQLVRQRLRNPRLLVGAEHRARPRAPLELPALVESATFGDFAIYNVVPARLTGPDDPALAFINTSSAASLRLMLSEEFAATMAAIASDPTPVGRFPHDPRVCVPDLVEAVAAAHGLTPDLATYYLQLLALPDPTDKRVAEWNGWSTATLKVVKAALAGTDLVVEAKRERAGRTLFLPGGWLARKAPDLPVEAWKAGLPLGLDGSLPDGRVLVTTTVPALFRAAWQRVTDGDTPRYHALSEKP
jgi:hypothetical protein